jgi:hypothetical protein
MAYHLTTLIREHDLRILVQLAVCLPGGHLWRTVEWLCGRSAYPLSLILVEVAGRLAGLWALWRSRRRVKRQGRSAPYVPLLQRVATAPELP